MMKLDDLCNVRLLDFFIQYVSLEISMQMFELVLFFFRRLKSWLRFYVISVCIVFIFVVVIVSGIIVRGGRNFFKDYYVLCDYRKLLLGFSFVQNLDIGDGWMILFYVFVVEILLKFVLFVL